MDFGLDVGHLRSRSVDLVLLLRRGLDHRLRLSLKGRLNLGVVLRLGPGLELRRGLDLRKWLHLGLR